MKKLLFLPLYMSLSLTLMPCSVFLAASGESKMQEETGQEVQMPEAVDWDHWVMGLLVYDADPETGCLTVYPGEEQEVTVDYSSFCRPEDVAGIYWCDYNDGCSYTLPGMPYAECLDDYDLVADSPYLNVSPMDDGMVISSKGIDWSDDSIAVMVLCRNGDYYWDFANYYACEERSHYYNSADILDYRTKTMREGYLYIEEGETVHLDLSWEGYCSEDEIASVELQATNDLSGEDGRPRYYTEDNVPQLEINRDVTGWTITWNSCQDDMDWYIVNVYITFNTGEEGLCDSLYVCKVDPDHLPEGYTYDRSLHYVVEADSESASTEGENDGTEVSENGSVEKQTPPQTGDSGHTGLWLMLAAVSAAGAFWGRGVKCNPDL